MNPKVYRNIPGIVISIFIIIICLATNVNAQIIADYPLDGNANDVSGNGHDGTVYGAVPTTDRDGTPNSALSFDGVNDYISVPNHPELSPEERIVVEAWMNPTEYPTNIGDNQNHTDE